MLEILKKTLLAGLGAAVITRDKIKEATSRLVEEGKISQQEAEQLAEQLLQSGRKQWDELESSIREGLEAAVKGLGVVHTEEFERLNRRVAMLEVKLATMEKPSEDEED